MWPFTPAYPDEGNTVYDYIVVEGQSSEDPTVRVLLIERGSALNTWASGIYTRGSAADFNRWHESGRQGWSYEEVEPFFIESEGFQGKTHYGSKGDYKYVFDFLSRTVEDARMGQIPPSLHRQVRNSSILSVEATQCLGIPVVDDINTPEAPAVACARLHVTLDNNARRCSTFDAFLPLDVALSRKDHLKICTKTVATSLHIKRNRATGVFFEGEEPEKQFYARARREVVVCCGAIASPQLLMLSGIGPASHLQVLRIDVVKDLPGVGTLPEPDFSPRTASTSELDSTIPANIPNIEIEVPPGTGVFSLLAILLQPQSHGTVRLASRDPRVRPTCDLARRLGQQMRASGYAMEDENMLAGEHEEDLDAFVKKSVVTALHCTSACRMAPETDVRPGVVDDRLRVHGVGGLRIADCSIFPDIVWNHPQAAAVMVAEKCAHMMLEDARYT
ncbi:hypothetical protein B0H17DRAFT_1162731 [Mycena rosella]|uniref:Glucose-methanol-choline oxidoreductase N-terminal domain-containing protein n=1 Tax=Mycena rosella TaxID=1033263 RepID=A0AAD7CUS0_MYCRO|nr:hypothetical protein B0H17DRAFT_1162731 [Mycena rosella]